MLQVIKYRPVLPLSLEYVWTGVLGYLWVNKWKRCVCICIYVWVCVYLCVLAHRSFAIHHTIEGCYRNTFPQPHGYWHLVTFNPYMNMFATWKGHKLCVASFPRFEWMYLWDALIRGVDGIRVSRRWLSVYLMQFCNIFLFWNINRGNKLENKIKIFSHKEIHVMFRLIAEDHRQWGDVWRIRPACAFSLGSIKCCASFSLQMCPIVHLNQEKNHFCKMPPAKGAHYILTTLQNNPVNALFFSLSISFIHCILKHNCSQNNFEQKWFKMVCY